jgi:hypothetical protein
MEEEMQHSCYNPPVAGIRDVAQLKWHSFEWETFCYVSVSDA